MGEGIVTASWDKSARIWDAATGKQIGSTLRHADRWSTPSLARTAGNVLTACRDNTARVWNASTGKQVACIRPGGHVAPRRFQS